MSSPAKVLAQRIITKIVNDLTDRRGLRQEWDQIDEDIKEEILEKWRKIVIEEVNKL